MTSHGSWDPLKELLGVQKQMNALFETALARTNFETSEGFDTWTPVCDAWETEESLQLAFELAGLEQDQLDVRVDGDDLVVEGERTMGHQPSGERYHRVERSYGRFQRKFRLPSTVDRQSIEASFKNGLLTVVLPKLRDAGNDSVRVVIEGS